jgi:hypothetical protein
MVDREVFMKPSRLPANKAEKYNEENYFNQRDRKDKEKRENVSSLYKDRRLPKSRQSIRRGK